MRRLLAVCIILAARAADDTRAAEAEADPELATDRLQARVDSLRGDDARLVRYSATDHTAAAQSSGACEPFARALGDVVVAAAKSGTLGAEPDREVLALQVAALCVVDNPAHRAKLSSVAGVHEAVAALVSSRDERVSAAASELVYIGAFANAKNHAGFIGAGAVAALGRIVLDEAASPTNAMWAAAALQNLFASYCAAPARLVEACCARESRSAARRRRVGACVRRRTVAVCVAVSPCRDVAAARRRVVAAAPRRIVAESPRRLVAAALRRTLQTAQATRPTTAAATGASAPTARRRR